MISRSVPIDDYFSHHPPKTEERKQKHAAINKAAKDFALLIDSVVEDEEMMSKILDYVQMARMLSNQAITFQEL